MKNKKIYTKMKKKNKSKLKVQVFNDRVNDCYETGNMWGQTWKNLQDLLLPFPNKPSVDVTQKMVQLVNMFLSGFLYFTIDHVC